MALEDALSQLNANILTLIEVIQKSDSQRAEIVDKAEAVLKRKDGGAAASKTTKKDEPKAEAEPEVKSETQSEPADDAGAVEEATKAVTAFVRAGGNDADDIAERKKEVRARLKKLGLNDNQRVGELDPASAKRLTASIEKLEKTYVPVKDRKPAGDDLDDI